MAATASPNEHWSMVMVSASSGIFVLSVNKVAFRHSGVGANCAPNGSLAFNGCLPITVVALGLLSLPLGGQVYIPVLDVPNIVCREVRKISFKLVDLIILFKGA